MIYLLILDLDVWCEYEYVFVLCMLVVNGFYLICLLYLDVECFIESGLLVVLNVLEFNMECIFFFIWCVDMEENLLVECIKCEGLCMMKGKLSIL